MRKTYKELIIRYGRVPITTVVYGECGAGKTFAVEVALSLFGCDNWIKVHSLSIIKARNVCSQSVEY